MARIGNIHEFDPSTETVSTYLEQVQAFLDANAIAEDKHVSVFLSVIGSKTYGLLCNLLAPSALREQNFKTLTDSLKSHFEPKPIVIAERFHFYRRLQGPGESIAAYLAELKRLAYHCQFEGHLEESLRDQLVCGLRSTGIQKRLLTEADLTYNKAIELALGMEAAEKTPFGSSQLTTAHSYCVIS